MSAIFRWIHVSIHVRLYLYMSSLNSIKNLISHFSSNKIFVIIRIQIRHRNIRNSLTIWVQMHVHVDTCIILMEAYKRSKFKILHWLYGCKYAHSLMDWHMRVNVYVYIHLNVYLSTYIDIEINKRVSIYLKVYRNKYIWL